MQIKKIAWKDVQQNYPELAKYDYETYVFNPKINRMFGTAYVELLRKRLRDRATTRNILASYNWGMRKVKSVNYDFNRFPRETRNYISKIEKLLKGGE